MRLRRECLWACERMAQARVSVWRLRAFCQCNSFVRMSVAFLVCVACASQFMAASIAANREWSHRIGCQHHISCFECLPAIDMSLLQSSTVFSPSLVLRSRKRLCCSRPGLPIPNWIWSWHRLFWYSDEAKSSVKPCKIRNQRISPSAGDIWSRHSTIVSFVVLWSKSIISTFHSRLNEGPHPYVAHSIWSSTKYCSVSIKPSRMKKKTNQIKLVKTTVQKTAKVHHTVLLCDCTAVQCAVWPCGHSNTARWPSTPRPHNTSNQPQNCP